jgi:hypothetical protein
MKCLIKINDRNEFLDTYGETVTVNMVSNMTLEDFEQRFETKSQKVIYGRKKNDPHYKYNQVLMLKAYKSINLQKFSQGRQNPLFDYLTKHNLQLKATDLKTSNWYYRVGGYLGISLPFIHRIELKTQIAQRLGQSIRDNELLLIQTEMQNNCDLDLSEDLTKNDIIKIFELSPALFSMRETQSKFHLARGMELSCPSYILEPFRNLCTRALPDALSEEHRYGYFMPSNLKK